MRVRFSVCTCVYVCALKMGVAKKYYTVYATHNDDDDDG